LNGADYYFNSPRNDVQGVVMKCDNPATAPGTGEERIGHFMKRVERKTSRIERMVAKGIIARIPEREVANVRESHNREMVECSGLIGNPNVVAVTLHAGVRNGGGHLRRIRPNTN
jgi:hypothetical protein